MTTSSQHRLMLRNLYWNMMSRCYDKRNKMHHRYGGRGIKVCVAWHGRMNEFINWATTNGWQPGLTIDRRDNDGNYTPENCRFVDRKTQHANRDHVATFLARSLGQKRRYRSQIERSKTSRAIRRSWKRPSRKRKQTAALKKAWKRPAYLNAHIDAKRRQWSNPKWRVATIAAIKRAKATNREVP